MNAIKLVKPQTPAEKQTRTVMDTILVTPKICETWQSPPFQRPVRENEKVRALAEKLKCDGGVWPGIVTLGVLNGQTYLIDGQHRRHAFLIAGLEEGYTDIRTHYFESMAQMGEEFVSLNGHLVTIRPDDILRGLEESVFALKLIREKCPFVGYDFIRRGPYAPMVSMSAIVRCWRGSSGDVPSPNTHGISVTQYARNMDEMDCTNLITFLNLAMSGWGRDREYARLWAGLNITLCMWLFRRLVLGQSVTQKTPKLTREVFKKCLMSLSASGEYLEWLVGRSMNDRDRSPCYQKIKGIFASRLFAESGKKYGLPQPSWSHS